jgi:hypothetical protein
MSKNLMMAHQQWRDRPADECYPDLSTLRDAVQARRSDSVASHVRSTDLQFVYAPQETGVDDIVLRGKQSKSVAVLNNWAFGQLCGLAKAPAEWLRRIPAPLVAENLNWALANSEREELLMMWQKGGGANGNVRAFTSTRYARLWDAEVVNAIGNLTQWGNNGWHRPPSRSDNEAPKGLYAGDRNVFVFMVNEDRRLSDGTDEGLARGFFCWNSEVGQMSFGFKAFLYRYVCGNHIVWGAEELFDLRMVHLGKGMTREAMSAIGKTLTAYINAPATQDQTVIDLARKKTVAKDAAEAVNWLQRPPRKWNQGQAISMVQEVERQGKDPTNLWELVNAGSLLSQNKKYADERSGEDRRAGKMLETIF